MKRLETSPKSISRSSRRSPPPKQSRHGHNQTIDIRAITTIAQALNNNRIILTSLELGIEDAGGGRTGSLHESEALGLSAIDAGVSVAGGLVAVEEGDADGGEAGGVAADALESHGSAVRPTNVPRGAAARARAARHVAGVAAVGRGLGLVRRRLGRLGPRRLRDVGDPGGALGHGDIGTVDLERQPHVRAGGEVARDPAVAEVDGAGAGVAERQHEGGLGVVGLATVAGELAPGRPGAAVQTVRDGVDVIVGVPARQVAAEDVVAAVALDEGGGLDGRGPEVDVGVDLEEVVREAEEAETGVAVLTEEVARAVVWVNEGADVAADAAEGAEAAAVLVAAADGVAGGDADLGLAVVRRVDVQVQDVGASVRVADDLGALDDAVRAQVAVGPPRQ